MTRDYCTLFDANYLPRGLALFRSLERHGADFRLWVLCMDASTFEQLTTLADSRLVPIRLEDFERGDERLLEAKGNRSAVEYYFTCTPSLVAYVLGREPGIALLTYLDADMYFFSSPEPVFDELGAGSVAIIPHRYPPALRELEKWGLYNVGWVSFRRDAAGTACLGWWRDRCLEWCYDRLEGDRFGDQKYLDAWPRTFDGVVVITHPGANLAPWNLANHHVTLDDGQVHVDGRAVVFFHFHGFKQLSRWFFDPNLAQFQARLTPAVRQGLFAPYIHELRRLARTPDLGGAPDIGRSIRVRQVPLGQRLRERVWLWLGHLSRRYVYVMNGRVL